MGSSVHPQAQLILDGKAAAGGPPLWELTPGAGAGHGRREQRAIIGPGPDVASVRDIVIPASGGRDARAGVLAVAAGAPGVVVYYHGGGWVVGSVDGWDASVPRAGGRVRVRRGERGLPARARARVPRRGRRRLRRAGVGRPAPGWRPGARSWSPGTARAATWPRSRRCGRGTSDGPALALQLLVYPVVDCDLDRTSYHEYDGAEFIVNRRDMAWYWDHYAPDPAARMNPYASPLRAAGPVRAAAAVPGDGGA